MPRIIAAARLAGMETHIRLPALTWVHWAILGLALGLLFRASWAYACSCAQPPLRMQLAEVTSTNPDVTHEDLWPELAEAFDYGWELRLTADDPDEGQVRSIECWGDDSW